MFRRMLLALGGNDSDAGVVEYAAMLGRIIPGMEIHAVHVAGANGNGLPDHQAQHISAIIPNATCHLLNGDVLDSLIDFAEKSAADLLILGHTRPGARRSLARRLAMKAPCSVWMVPDGARPSITAVLAPVDLSPRSADTLDAATHLAFLAGLDECLALHVYFNDAVATFDEFEETLFEQTDQAFAVFIAPIDVHGVDTRALFVESADVPHTILRIAAERGSDLIVMGTRGRSASAAVLLGSETEQVIIDSAVPLLAVKHHGAQLRLRQVLASERLRQRSDLRYG